MKTYAIVTLLCAALAGGVVLAGDAETVTLEGKVMCAKCALHEEGRAKCQNVLVVEKKGEPEYYYMAKNSANDEFGEVCMATPIVRVKGTVEKKDGQTWIAATEITRVEKKDQG